MGRNRRLASGALAAVAAIGLATACDPNATGALNSAAVAVTTDQVGTEALERAGIKVRWMSCTAQMGTRPGATFPANAEAGRTRQVAKVACEGETTSRTKLTLRGKVTEERDGHCVRGALTAKAGTRTLFRANVLGNCDEKPGGSRPPSRTKEPTARPTVTRTVSPPGSERPTSRPPATPPVTVTVTSSPDPPPSEPSPDPSPTCRCGSPEHKAARADR